MSIFNGKTGDGAPLKCPVCGGPVRPRVFRCSRCGRLLARPEKALKRTMPLSPKWALACGALLTVGGGMLFLTGTDEFAAVLLCLGLPLALIGLFMR